MKGRDPHEAHRVATPLELRFIYAHYYYLVRRFDPFHLWLLIATAAVVAVAVIAALSGINMAGCLVILMLAPFVSVVGYEMLGYRHQAKALTDLRATHIYAVPL